MIGLESGNITAIMLVILCILASLDLWRQIAIKSESFWRDHYLSAVKSSYNFWSMGYRLEDMELKLQAQHSHLSNLLHHVDVTIAPKFSLNRNTLRHNVGNIEFTREARIGLHDMIRNDTQVYQIRCGTDGPNIRIGVNDFRTDSRDQCQLFTSPKVRDTVDPHTMFDLIPMPEGAFALRSVANNMFVKTVPPPGDNEHAPWKLMIGGPLVGIAETFRLSEEGYLYSPLLEGFFTCAAGQMISGYPGRYGSFNRFVLEPVTREDVTSSYTLVDLSKKVSKIQTKYHEEKAVQILAAKKKARDQAAKEKQMEKEKEKDGKVEDEEPPTKICMAIPMTSKGTDMKEVVDSPFWSNLFDSFMRSIDWRSNKYVFKFYLGFDKADEIYDTGDAWSEMREEFKHRAIFRMTEQMMTEETITAVLEKFLFIKLMHFDHLDGAPSQIVSQLVLTAYAEDFDYFYQVNDDTIIQSPNWAPRLIANLQGNPSIPNFGATGPKDSNNEKIFTHSFVHRTHIDVGLYLYTS